MVLRIEFLSFYFLLASLYGSTSTFDRDQSPMDKNTMFDFSLFEHLVSFENGVENRKNSLIEEQKQSVLAHLAGYDGLDLEYQGNVTDIHLMVALSYWKDKATDLGIDVHRLEQRNYRKYINDPENSRNSIMKRSVNNFISAANYLTAFSDHTMDRLVKRYRKEMKLNKRHGRGNTSQAIISKRSIRDIGKGVKRASQVARAVLRTVGTVSKKVVTNAKTFLKKFFKTIKGGLESLKKKLSKAVSRAKTVFQKAKKNKFLRFMNATGSVVWAAIPDKLKNLAVDSAFPIEIGGEGDVNEGMDEMDFNPEELKSDDELADSLVSELDLVDDESEADINSFSGVRDFMVNPLPKVANVRQNSCCFSGESEDEEDEDFMDDEDVEIVEELDNGIEVSLEDFNPDSLSEMNINTDDMTDMSSDKNGYGGFDPDFIDSITKRNFMKPQKVSKRSNSKHCPCNHKTMMKRELIHSRMVKKNLGMMPSLIDAINPATAKAMLKESKIKGIKNICMNNGNDAEDCINFDGVRMGAICALTTLRVLCPLCDIKILEATESAVNEFLKGWTFSLEGTETLSAFLMDAMSDYDTQPFLYDANNNRYELVKESETQFHWEVLVHL